MDSGASENVPTIQRLAVRAASTALNRLHHQYDEFAQFPYHQRLNSAQENFVGIFPILRRIIFYLLLGSFLFMTSVTTYGLFYLAVMPAHAATEQLYFDYSCIHTDFSNARATTCSNDTAGECNNIACTPSATVDIFARHSSWEAFHPDVIPDARTQTRILTPRVPYFFEVVLQLPETTTNQQIGMFAIEVELSTKNHTLLAKSQRSSRLPHESGWIAVVRKLFCLIPLLIGAMTETKRIVIPSFRHFVESTNHPLQHVVVRLVSQGSSWHGNRPTEVVGGEIRIGKELNRFQNTLKEWFWTCFIAGSLIIFTLQSLFYCVAHVLWAVGRQILLPTREEDHIDLGDAPYFFDATPPESDVADADSVQHWEPIPTDSPNENVPSTIEEPDLRSEAQA